jgi:hypothetical protein
MRERRPPHLKRKSRWARAQLAIRIANSSAQWHSTRSFPPPSHLTHHPTPAHSGCLRPCGMARVKAAAGRDLHDIMDDRDEDQDSIDGSEAEECAAGAPKFRARSVAACAKPRPAPRPSRCREPEQPLGKLPDQPMEGEPEGAAKPKRVQRAPRPKLTVDLLKVGLQPHQLRQRRGHSPDNHRRAGQPCTACCPSVAVGRQSPLCGGAPLEGGGSTARPAPLRPPPPPPPPPLQTDQGFRDVFDNFYPSFRAGFKGKGHEVRCGAAAAAPAGAPAAGAGAASGRARAWRASSCRWCCSAGRHAPPPSPPSPHPAGQRPEAAAGDVPALAAAPLPALRL